MTDDRLLFDPCPLAIAKGIVYLLAFLTSMSFESFTDRNYYFGILIFCCGVLCDYIEIAAYREDKCVTVRRISVLFSVVIGVLIVGIISLLYKFEQIPELILCLAKYSTWINFGISFFWAAPLCCGIYLAMISIHEKPESYSEPLAYGYRVKP